MSQLRKATVCVFGVLLTSALGLTSFGQEVEYTESFEPNPAYKAEWCRSGNDMRFRISARARGWVAIGFNDQPQMPGSDVIMVTGEGDIQDAFAPFRSAPSADAAQDVTLLSAEEIDSMTTVEFSRPVVTADEDNDIPLDADRFVVWAFNSSTDSFRSRHSSRGVSPNMINLSAAGECVTTPVFDEDFTGDGVLDVNDINALLVEVNAMTNAARFDVNGDGAVNQADIAEYVATTFNSYIGDSNLDGEFSTSDFVAVFTAGEYEDAVEDNSTWEEGDWNGDLDFGTSDLVFAFQEQGFEKGPREQNLAVVPEPSANLLVILGSLLGLVVRRPTR